MELPPTLTANRAVVQAALDPCPSPQEQAAWTHWVGTRPQKALSFKQETSTGQSYPLGASDQGCCSTLQCPGQVQNTRHLLPTKGRLPPRVLTPLGLGKPAWHTPGPHQPLHRELAHGPVGPPSDPLELSHPSPTWPPPPPTSSLSLPTPQPAQVSLPETHTQCCSPHRSP